MEDMMIEEDIVRVKELVILSYVLRTFKILIIIGCISFFFAMIFKVMLEIERDLWYDEDPLF